MKTKLSFALGLLLIVTINSPAQLKIEEQVVGPAMEAGTIYTLSPKGLHLATVHPKGSRFVVTVDGVEGEKFDEILNAAGEVEARLHPVTGDVMMEIPVWEGPVAFSPDGSRHAYAARRGQDVIVTLDGKEIFRTAHSLISPVVAMLGFTPDGRNCVFHAHTGETGGSHRLMFDGREVTPTYVGNPTPVFSADGSRWALIGKRPMKDETFLIVDGKDAGYPAHSVRFTPDGKHVIAVQRTHGAQTVLRDGKPVMTLGSTDRLVISPTGDLAATSTGNDSQRRLIINGKTMPGTEGASTVVFSPDGKRWAVSCVSVPAWHVVVDGQRHPDYSMVSQIAFTPDSSKCVYVAEAGYKKFVVIDGEEDEGNNILREGPMLGKSGNHVAYCAGGGLGTFKIYHDGKIVVPKGQSVSRLTLSPDGARHAFYSQVDVFTHALIVDGEVIGGGAREGGNILFSSDSRHTAAPCLSPKGEPAIYLDGRFGRMPAGLSYAKLLAFTPDNQHLLIHGSATTRDGSHLFSYSLDGHPAAHFSCLLASGLLKGNQHQALLSEQWEVQPDGSVLLIGHTFEGGNIRGPVKRVKVTPAPGTSIATWGAESQTAQNLPPAAVPQPQAAAPTVQSAPSLEARPTTSQPVITAPIPPTPPVTAPIAPTGSQTEQAIRKVGEAAATTKAAMDVAKKFLKFGK